MIQCPVVISHQIFPARSLVLHGKRFEERKRPCLQFVLSIKRLPLRNMMAYACGTDICSVPSTYLFNKDSGFRNSATHDTNKLSCDSLIRSWILATCRDRSCEGSPGSMFSLGCSEELKTSKHFQCQNIL